MISYSGPKTRHVEKLTGDGFTKEGRVGYLESRDVFVKQVFKVEQLRSGEDFNSHVPLTMVERSGELQVNPAIGASVHFSQPHVYDRLSLNTTMTSVRFKPDNAFNSVQTETDVETRLAPFLTAQHI